MSNTMSDPVPILKVKHLSISIGGNVLVNDISFTLFASERVCLIGASGSGKSLTAKAITGILPTGAHVAGRIKVDNVDVSQLHASRRRHNTRVSMVFQDPSTALNPLLPIGKQLSLAMKTDSRLIIRDLLEKLKLGDIPDLLNRYPSEISGGQQQRICIALALMGNNRLLVADEPTTALDVISQQQVLRVLADRSQQTGLPALLFITHDIAVAAQLCQRGIVMENGRIVESGDMRQLLENPTHSYTQRLVYAAHHAQRLLRNDKSPTKSLSPVSKTLPSMNLCEAQAE
ncbi:TPA: ABC transporter ATP-binding protein [Providencia rettgeri]|uniref:ATP-binding cassette domain-containing protein n=2 Tax=Morganellaceae TaxID=1903414 RepID=UPI001B973CB4|nr:ABC transporter ATP-binding protein [Providencia rettgeri]HBC7430061.1 ABC transporter ATP-binding protein [Providencia rettgeri]HEM7189293.1 ABC transporter ATP-binding protein [Providencia rettgeri]